MLYPSDRLWYREWCNEAWYIGIEGEEVEKIRPGKTGIMVSRIGFGGIPIQKSSKENI